MLRTVQNEDISTCARLFRDIYTGEPWRHDCVTQERALRYITDLAQTPGFIGFLFYVESEPVGMVLGVVNNYFFDPQYDIKELTVAAAYQRQGVGTRMLDAVEASLHERGVAYVTLQTSRDIPAYAFYLKGGYLPVEPTVSMAKPL